MTTEAFTINQFCSAHGISRATFYNLRRAGKGPREMNIGATARISREAAEEWRREREAEALTKARAA